MTVFTILQNFITIRQKEPCLKRKYVDFQKMLSDPCLNIAESEVDANRTLVSNIGRAIIKKLAVKFEGNEIMSIDDFSVFASY